MLSQGRNCGVTKVSVRTKPEFDAVQDSRFEKPVASLNLETVWLDGIVTSSEDRDSFPPFDFMEYQILHWHRRREPKVELAPEALQITAPMVRDLCGFTAPASAGTNAARLLPESTCLFRGGLPSCKNFQLASREIGAQWGMLNLRLFDPLVLGNSIGSNGLISDVGGMKFFQLLPVGWRGIWITPLLPRVESLSAKDNIA